MTLKGSEKFPSVLLLNYHSLVCGYKQLSGGKKGICKYAQNLKSLLCGTILRSGSWSYSSTKYLQKSSVRREFLVFNKPKNGLIRICEFRHASFLGRRLAEKVVEKHKLKPKLYKKKKGIVPY